MELMLGGYLTLSSPKYSYYGDIISLGFACAAFIMMFILKPAVLIFIRNKHANALLNPEHRRWVGSAYENLRLKGGKSPAYLAML